MEQNDRRKWNQDDDYRSSNYNDRNRNYNSRDNYFDRDSNYNNRDRNVDWGPDYRGYNNSDRRNYSNDQDGNYWDNRQQMSHFNNDSNDIRSGERSYNRPDSSYMNNENRNRPWYENNNNRYRNDEWRNSRNEGWRDNYRNYNDRNDRDWWDKTKDEVSSWFGDDDAARRRRMDEYREGQHRGKGPKNYNRSKERIKEDASDKLSDDSLLDASNIEIEVNDNELTLNGTVDTRYEKRRAEDLVESVSGVQNVQNNLRVVSRDTTGSNSVSNTDLGTNSTYSATKNTTKIETQRS